MAQPSAQLGIFAFLDRLRRYQSLFLPVAMMGLLSVIVVPLPPVLMDVLIASNIALAALTLLNTIYVQKPLEFSAFPSLLLATTLFRLVLNIATTRLILSADAASAQQATDIAGKVIEAFASFVAGNSLVVGLIIFIILIIVQFVVITKGATRISEVAARFTLDGMPGKQMAIDADLNAGLISEEQARNRRDEISQEADFYGAMDGAAKFVRGDAIAGIIITLVNIVGGLVVGVFIKGWTVTECLDLFTRLTIGDGLVSQIPAFIISIAAGLIVTRSSGRHDLGKELAQQLTSSAGALGVTSAFLLAMAFTGLPAFPMLMLSGLSGSIAWFVSKGNRQEKDTTAKQEHEKETASTKATPEDMLNVDMLELEVGYALVRLVDQSSGGTLLDRISMMRQQLAGELGLIMPPVRIRDNMQLSPNDYHVKIRSNSVAQGSVYPGQFLAMDSGLASEPLEGIRTHEPAFGLEAWWIQAGAKQRAESLNYTVVDATSVLVTHLTEVVKTHAHEMLSREETNNLIDQLRERAPKLIAEVLGEGDKVGLIKPGELQRVLQNLLSERVPIRDLESIIETLGDWAPRTHDLEVLTEYVRNTLRRTICSQYVAQPGQDDGLDQEVASHKLYCVSIDPAMEDMINGYIDRGPEGTTMTMPPAVANNITRGIIKELQYLIQLGHQPVVLASPQVRAQVHRLLEPHLQTAAVLGYNEISKGVEVESLGLAQLPVDRPSAEVTKPELEGAMI